MRASRIFQDRQDAAQQLIARLQTYRGQHPLILAIPRGSVPMGKIIAKALQGDFDTILVRKLRLPAQPEVAMGSVDESGWTYLLPHASMWGLTPQDVEAEKKIQLATIQTRRAQYTPIRKPIDPANRIVIVVDDGLATGATMMAALHSLRQHHPAKLVCAIPVASHESLSAVRQLADEVVCLITPENFQAVGQFYRDFRQVEDDEVIAILAQ